MFGVAWLKWSVFPMTNQSHKPRVISTVRSGNRPGTVGGAAEPLETTPMHGVLVVSRLGKTCIQPAGPSPKANSVLVTQTPGGKLPNEYQPDSALRSILPSPLTSMLRVR